MPKAAAPSLRLGLIGGNIRRSHAPFLHRLCGELTRIEVNYELIVPAERGADFDAVFDACRRSGMRGVNVTYPFKEQAVGRVRIPDAEVTRIGSINTVVFDPDGPVGYNTDFTGFMAAFRATFGQRPAGSVALFGAGGVGRAIAFALIDLGATELRLVDRDRGKAEGLAAALSGFAGAGVGITVAEDAETAMDKADGVVNATPLGMYGYPGSAVPSEHLTGRHWAFDAVYTPLETEFLRASRAAGLSIMSGYELFFFQGVQAFELFAGKAPADLGILRHRLAEVDTP